MQQVIADADIAEAEVMQFNEAWDSFWERNLAHMGAVLVCHLAVEHYLDEWLSAANPGTKPIDQIRLSFAQKLEFSDNTDSIV